jgi:AbiJ N-terminal domain 4
VTPEQFSRRRGFSTSPAEIRIRNDAPPNVRGALLMILEGELQLRPNTIRDWLCTVLREFPDQNNWSEYPNIWQECQNLMYGAPWYRVYDFVELVYHRLANSQGSARAEQWANAVNEYFVETGVGWRLVEGQLESRGQEAFETAVDSARQALDEAALTTAKQEIHEALRDLSRRPEPDLTGAVQHAMAGLECTARQATNDGAPRSATYCDAIQTSCLALWMNLCHECGATRPKWRATFGKAEPQDDLRQSWLSLSPLQFVLTWLKPSQMRPLPPAEMTCLFRMRRTVTLHCPANERLRGLLSS